MHFLPFLAKIFTKPYFKHPSNTNCSIIFNCTFFYNKNCGTHSLLHVDHAKACIVAFRAEKEMECSANSIELFEKEPSLVHHINRLETWDTGKTHPNKNWLNYLFTHYKRNWNSLIQCFLVNVASSITLNWKQFKVHLFSDMGQPRVRFWEFTHSLFQEVRLRCSGRQLVEVDRRRLSARAEKSKCVRIFPGNEASFLFPFF